MTNNLPELKIIRKTHIVDASTASFGRIATHIARLLMGKNKPTYLPHVDMGDIVLVENINKIKVTGKKMEQKNYYSHSGYPGGLKTKKMKELWANDPFIILQKAVYNMLPKNRLRDKRIKRLKVKK